MNAHTIATSEEAFGANIGDFHQQRQALTFPQVKGRELLTPASRRPLRAAAGTHQHRIQAWQTQVCFLKIQTTHLFSAAPSIALWFGQGPPDCFSHRRQQIAREDEVLPSVSFSVTGAGAAGKCVSKSFGLCHASKAFLQVTHSIDDGFPSNCPAALLPLSETGAGLGAYFRDWIAGRSFSVGL